MLIRKPASNGFHRELPLQVEQDLWFSGYPALFEFLTLDKWEDGAKRQRGTVTVFFEEGRWKCWVNDKDAARSACVTARTLDEVVSLTESGLVADSLDWRRARPSRDRRS